MTRHTHHRACHLCEAICGLIIETEGEQILSIKGDKNDPLSRGHICPKAVALQDIHNDPDRLRQPVKKVRHADGSVTHEPIAWDEALDKAAAAMADSIERYGVNSVGVYMGNPTIHNYGMMTHQGALFKLIRTNNRFSATSVDQLPHHLASMWLFGHKLMFPIPDIDRSNYFLMLGGNPLASNGSIWTVPDIKQRIKDFKARGGQLIVLDPRRTETAEVATEHHFIKPGTDALFIMALLHVIFRDGLVNMGKLAEFTDGIEHVAAAVEAFTPELAERHTGISAATIERIAHDFAGSPAAICYGRMGVSVQRFGALNQWAIQVINTVTGNIDREGGSMFTLPAVDQVRNTGPGGFGRHRSRQRGLPEFDRELPSAALAEEITTPGEGQIKVLFTGAGNPVLSTPNGRNLDAALEQLDFMVSLDPYLNETTRHADIILPPTSPLEHDHYDLGFHVNAMRNTARYNPAVFEKPEDALHDWEIFVGLGERVAARLGLEAPKRIPPHMIIDAGIKGGPYGEGTDLNLSLQSLIDTPSGIDLGELQPLLPDRLQTKDKRINLATPEPLSDLPRLLAEFSESGSDNPPFQLIGRRHVRDCNSWMHNYHRLVKGKNRCTLMMHPEDAATLNLDDGALVSVASRIGQIEALLEITDQVMPGVVSLPHGYGHDRAGIRMDTAIIHKGVSCNDVTDHEYLDELSGNAAVNGVPVSVSAA